MEIQDAMQWWHQRRSLRSDQQAAEIRHHLLQELFSLRRSLELANSNADQHQQWLGKVEGLQRSLENLSHQLAPPYLEASLSLALQFAIEQWKVQHPEIQFEMHSTHSQQQDSLEHNRVILEVLNEWLRLNLPVCDLAIALNHQGNDHTLMLQVNYADAEKLEATLKSVEVQYLSRVFELLISGKTEVKQQGQRAVWYFFWKGESPSLSA